MEVFSLTEEVARLKVDVAFGKAELTKAKWEIADKTKEVETLKRENSDFTRPLTAKSNENGLLMKIQLLEADVNLYEETIASLRRELERVSSTAIEVFEPSEAGADQLELIASQGHSNCYTQIEDLDRQNEALKERLDLACTNYEILNGEKDALNVQLDAEGISRRDTEVRFDELKKKCKGLERRSRSNGFDLPVSSTSTTA